MHYLKLTLMIVLAGTLLGTIMGIWFGKGMTSIYTEFYKFPLVEYELPLPILVAAGAMAISGHALRVITGLENMDWQTVDRVSQAMIDGIANYASDPEIEARCRQATATKHP